MIGGKKVLALIPARGGSKRLPRKNILPLAGKPLIGWTIEAAKKSKYIDQVIVSTDDKEIIHISESFGAEVPEVRPSELSGDSATTESVVFHILEKYGNAKDILVLLQPTSPLRDANDIDEAIELIIQKAAISIVSVTKCEHPPHWTNMIPSDGSMKDFLKNNHNKRSQDFGSYFRLNGAIYVYDINYLNVNKDMKYTDRTFAYEMNNLKSVDIDNDWDFKYAEFLLDNIYDKSNQ